MFAYTFNLSIFDTRSSYHGPSRSQFRQQLFSQYDSCLAHHMNFWLKFPYLQPPNDLFPPLFCLLKLVQPIGILTYMNGSSLRLDLTSSYLYSFRELNSFPQLLLNLLLFRSKQLPCCFRAFCKTFVSFQTTSAWFQEYFFQLFLQVSLFLFCCLRSKQLFISHCLMQIYDFDQLLPVILWSCCDSVIQ
ncbi:Hypothetical_protein [Hexamita inflata]|uniref:Hypothetical_protein n=1 Tax=Hexamita inflata TaxID=28002 RepID=A0AA86P9C1_9EUKA|nr:Hypothetical protein HINF_LOCUS20260 [Hexamita inflata]